MWDRKIICLTTEAGTGIHAYSNGNFVAFEIDLDDTSELEKMIEESNKAWENIDVYLRLQATNITLVLMNKSNDPNATEQFTNRVEHRGKYTAEIANYLKPLICSKIQHCRRGNTEGRDEIFKALLDGTARKYFYPFDDEDRKLDEAVRDSNFNEKEEKSEEKIPENPTTKIKFDEDDNLEIQFCQGSNSAKWASRWLKFRSPLEFLSFAKDELEADINKFQSMLSQLNSFVYNQLFNFEKDEKFNEPEFKELLKKFKNNIQYQQNDAADIDYEVEKLFQEESEINNYIGSVKYSFGTLSEIKDKLKNKEKYLRPAGVIKSKPSLLTVQTISSYISGLCNDISSIKKIAKNELSKDDQAEINYCLIKIGKEMTECKALLRYDDKFSEVLEKLDCIEDAMSAIYTTLKIGYSSFSLENTYVSIFENVDNVCELCKTRIK